MPFKPFFVLTSSTHTQNNSTVLHSEIFITYYYVELAVVIKLLFSTADDVLQEKYKAYHHLLKEVNDFFFWEVHGPLIKKRLRNRKFSLGRQGICWVLYQELFLLRPRFPKTGNTITLKENRFIDILKYRTASELVLTIKYMDH